MLPILSQQPHAVDAGDSRDRNHFRHVLEVNVVISFDVGDPLHANGENIPQPFAQVVPFYRFFIDHHLRMLGLSLSCLRMPSSRFRVVDLNHDRRLRWRDRGIRGLGLLRKLCLQSGWSLLDHNHHEYDDEHQQNVNQRSDVHLWASRKRTTACRGESHWNFSLSGTRVS